MTTRREKQIRESMNDAADRENLQKATVMMSTEKIAELWARTAQEKGEQHADALALSEALDYRSTEPDRLREDARARLSVELERQSQRQLDVGDRIPLPDYRSPYTGLTIVAPKGWTIERTRTAYELSGPSGRCSPNMAPADVRDAFREFMRGK